MTTTQIDIDEQKAGVFAEHMVEVLNHASLALMTSIGHQVGLFDTLADLPPSTSAEIASASSLNERYVREWLGAMTVGGVVQYEPERTTYSLLREHAASLTRSAGPGNLASTMQLIQLFAALEQPIIECFRTGGGVPYSAFRRFQRVMAEESAGVNDALLIDAIVPLVPGLREKLQTGIDVADIGCGQGHAMNLLAGAFPASRFVGYDVSEEAIAVACAEADSFGLQNVQFEVRDVTVLALDSQFDLITAFDAIHDQAHPAQVLASVARALRPDGALLMVDVRASSRLEENIDLPLATMLYTTSTMHCMTVSLAQGGVGLGTVWGEQLARKMLADAGFTRVEVHGVDGDILNNYFVATKD